MTKVKGADESAMESFFSGATKMMQAALFRRLGFTCVIEPFERKATAKLFDQNGTPTATITAAPWKQMRLFDEPEAPATPPPSPTADAMPDDFDDDTEAEAEPPPDDTATRYGFPVDVFAKITDSAADAFHKEFGRGVTFSYCTLPCALGLHHDPLPAWWTTLAFRDGQRTAFSRWLRRFNLRPLARDESPGDTQALDLMAALDARTLHEARLHNADLRAAERAGRRNAKAQKAPTPKPARKKARA